MNLPENESCGYQTPKEGQPIGILKKSNNSTDSLTAGSDRLMKVRTFQPKKKEGNVMFNVCIVK